LKSPDVICRVSIELLSNRPVQGRIQHEAGWQERTGIWGALAPVAPPPFGDKKYTNF